MNPSKGIEEVFTSIERVSFFEYQMSDLSKKIEILVKVYLELLGKCEKKDLEKLKYICEIAERLTQEVPSAGFELVYDRISDSRDKEGVKAELLGTLNAKYPPRARFYALLDESAVSWNKELGFKNPVSFKSIISFMQVQDSDLSINYLGSHVEIRQEPCDGDRSFFYYQCFDKIKLVSRQYFYSMKEEIYIREAAHLLIFVFREIDYLYDGQILKNKLTNLPENLKMPGFRFEVRNGEWFAVKIPENDSFMRSFHSANNSSNLSEPIILQVNSRIKLSYQDKNFTVNFSYF